MPGSAFTEAVPLGGACSTATCSGSAGLLQCPAQPLQLICTGTSLQHTQKSLGSRRHCADVTLPPLDDDQAQDLLSLDAAARQLHDVLQSQPLQPLCCWGLHHSKPISLRASKHNLQDAAGVSLASLHQPACAVRFKGSPSNGWRCLMQSRPPSVAGAPVNAGDVSPQQGILRPAHGVSEQPQ